MRIVRSVALGAAMLALVVSACSSGGAARQHRRGRPVRSRASSSLGGRPMPGPSLLSEGSRGHDGLEFKEITALDAGAR